ncbi:uncharacterized protein N7446_009550 [Penicillium canescens]|uniref:Uncharacterized protein n=1 Tax=Penicillium canescens TaxID=5083 RepID=A0AAD6I838_PENCN|nr:uncharacterized protein N7446_009550 [Penicillium canescens]KAJ6034796.1 hypothetical protein N7460_008971 [Penicillium canescens]KAJ6046459.1 hypothetical protein N7444_007713 [Penicillium canescens]KAJ6053538.1 hypothetical protein N7446_009550 [Penicillium canescens]
MSFYYVSGLLQAIPVVRARTKRSYRRDARIDSFSLTDLLIWLESEFFRQVKLTRTPALHSDVGLSPHQLRYQSVRRTVYSYQEIALNDPFPSRRPPITRFSRRDMHDIHGKTE